MNPLAYLVETVFQLFTLALLLRFLLQLVRANFYNPVSQALVQITDPVLRPLRRVVPGIGGVDVAAIVAMIAVQMLGVWAVAAIGDVGVSAGWLFIAAVYRVIDLALLTLIITIVIQAVVSWINPGAANPAVSLLRQLNAPVLRPFRRVLPPLGGLDLSPVFALIALQFMRLMLRWLF